MDTTIIDGKGIARGLEGDLAAKTEALLERGGRPCLAVVLVGDDPASQVYVRHKTRAAERIGVEARDYKMPADASTAQVLAQVEALNDDPLVDGILVQLPLPPQVDENRVLLAIAPHKDVDGFHPDNLGRLVIGTPRFVACTPRGCLHLIRTVCPDLSGKRALVVGRSTIVGKPMALLLTQAHATVTVAHSRTADLAEEVAQADIVVAAVGRPEMIRGAWIREGAVVIDVGINRGSDGKLLGDVEFNAALGRAGAITPVPGGVGPMTIACLMTNVVEAAQRRLGGA
ncbi:MAG: bifunctional methylenetetrahydrofolate dehydrogenase/methenyltetrahydrofolate cyclohydrolase FolD [Nannocystaceae bacterium]